MSVIYVDSAMRNIFGDISIFALLCSCDSLRRVDRSQTNPSTWNVAKHACNWIFSSSNIFYSAPQYSPQSRDILRVVAPGLEDQQSESERGNGDGGESEQKLEAGHDKEGEEPEPEDKVHLGNGITSGGGE